MSESPEFDTAEYPAIEAFGPGPEPRAPRPVSVRFGGLSHPGKVRTNNEDHFLVGRIRRSAHILLTNLPDGLVRRERDDDGYVMVVADGMGGAASGEHASMLAILTGLRLVVGSNRWHLSEDPEAVGDLLDRMRKYFSAVDEALFEQARTNPQMAGMGTTLVVSYSVGDNLFIIHAGDSRAYLLRGGYLEPLTRDHTLAQLLVESGQIRPEEVGTHSKRHVLTNYLGGPSPGVKAEIHQFRLVDDDRVLLCSDGLTEMVPDELIAETLRRHPEPETACRALIERALEAGGTDNITVVLADYSIPDEPTAEAPPGVETRGD